MMRITLIAYGTRGDVQPAIALGKRLRDDGHAVLMLAGQEFRSWIESHGLPTAPCRVNIADLMGSDLGHEWSERGTNVFAMTRIMRKALVQTGRDIMHDAWNAAQGAQVIFSSFTSDLFAVSIAERLNLKHVSIPLQPTMIATRSGAASNAAVLPNRTSILNYWLGKLALERFTWNLYGDIANRFREETLRLPPQTYAQNRAAHQRMLVMMGYSRYVVPHPADWAANLHTTGYWFLDEGLDYQPSAELQQFLAAGDPPVCYGFSSMTGRDAERMTALVTQAALQSGRRAILLSGAAGIGATGIKSQASQHNHIFTAASVPHEWLFPRMAAVVHHGGAGTTGAGLRAGMPTVIIPHLGDQPFWGRRVEALGVGPRAIPRHQLTAEKLASAVRVTLTDTAMQRRARDLGARIRAEDGIGNAMELFRKYVEVV